LYKILPETFITEGTVFVYPVNSSNQKSEVSNELNYARNLIALSNSPEFKESIKSELKYQSFVPLIGLTNGIKFKEISPNILILGVTSSSKEGSEKIYNSYLNELKEFSNLLNKGNSSFEITTLREFPVTYNYEKDLFLFIMLGLVIGLFSFFIYVYLKND
jgi:hypothetical protein